MNLSPVPMGLELCARISKCTAYTRTSQERCDFMPIASFTVRSTAFLDELQARRDSFGSTVAYRITVPESLSYWYLLEFGTGGRQDPSAPYRTEIGEGRTYPIDPINGKALHWEDNGEQHFAFHVNHPGIRPRLIYRGVRDDILNYAGLSLGNFLVNEGMRLSSVADSLETDVMPYAVQAMGDAFENATPSLKGSVAAEWNAGASIVAVDAGDSGGDGDGA